MAQALYLNLILVLWRGIEMIWGQNRGKKKFFFSLKSLFFRIMFTLNLRSDVIHFVFVFFFVCFYS